MEKIITTTPIQSPAEVIKNINVQLVKFGLEIMMVENEGDVQKHVINVLK